VLREKKRKEMRKKERRVFFVSSPAVGVFFCVCLQVKKEKEKRRGPLITAAGRRTALSSREAGQNKCAWGSPRVFGARQGLRSPFA
jgi:hypothetical protein